MTGYPDIFFWHPAGPGRDCPGWRHTREELILPLGMGRWALSG